MSSPYGEPRDGAEAPNFNPKPYQRPIGTPGARQQQLQLHRRGTDVRDRDRVDDVAVFARRSIEHSLLVAGAVVAARAEGLDVAGAGRDHEGTEGVEAGVATSRSRALSKIG